MNTQTDNIIEHFQEDQSKYYNSVKNPFELAAKIELENLIHNDNQYQTEDQEETMEEDMEEEDMEEEDLEEEDLEEEDRRNEIWQRGLIRQNAVTPEWWNNEDDLGYPTQEEINAYNEEIYYDHEEED